MPQISIIVPVYNAEKYLARCIESILAQTFTDFELILVNDGSSDESFEIIEKYVKKDSRIVSIHQKNQGVSAARNAGLNVVKGKYIGFVDADDTIESEMYQKLFEVIETSESDVAICNWKNIDEEQGVSFATLEQKDIVVLDKEELLDKIFQRNQRWMFITIWNKLFKAEIAKKILFDSTISFGEDTWYAFCALFHAQKIVYLTRPLYNYYIYSGTASHGGITGKQRLVHVEIYRKISKELKKAGYSSLASDVYAFYIDFILREINENKKDKIYQDLLRKTLKQQWFGILTCTKMTLKLKMCYLLHMLTS